MSSRKGQQGLGESEQGLVVLSILSHDLENETLVKFVDDPQLKGEGTADAVMAKLCSRGALVNLRNGLTGAMWSHQR